jgi:hypothetical protein
MRGDRVQIARYSWVEDLRMAYERYVDETYLISCEVIEFCREEGSGVGLKGAFAIAFSSSIDCRARS